jgi:hypothetical protein
MGAATATASFASLPQDWSGRSGSPREWLVSGRAAGRAVPDPPGWISRYRRRTTYTAMVAHDAGGHLGSEFLIRSGSSNRQNQSDVRVICWLLLVWCQVDIDLLHQLHGGICHRIGCCQ